MRKILMAAVVIAAVQLGFSNVANAQSTYKTGLGMRIDLGTGGTYVGFGGKHFFNEKNAAEASLLFGTGVTILGVEYQYHGQIPNAAGLKWYAGLGPALAFAKGGNTELLLRPLVGLDYKINNVPLGFAFDWRPYFSTASGVEQRFQAARFGIALRYAF